MGAYLDPAVNQAVRIVCIGNRFVQDDSLGIKVYDTLRGVPMPDNVALVEGGLFGLDLLPFLEEAARVVFVDALAGVPDDDAVCVFAGSQIKTDSGARFDHSNSFLYLLGILPYIMGRYAPDVYIVGSAGAPGRALVQAVARRALEVARSGT